MSDEKKRPDDQLKAIEILTAKLGMGKAQAAAIVDSFKDDAGKLAKVLDGDFADCGTKRPNVKENIKKRLAKEKKLAEEKNGRTIN